MKLNSVVRGDCLKVLKTLPDNSVDCLVTDPPAGIAFMGKHWDGDRSGMIHWVNWLSEILSEALRVMKPGACGAVWSIPRTCGWTQLAIELAGFKVWDSVAVMQGQGFPKAQDIGKQIDTMMGAEREIIGQALRPDGTTRDSRKGGASARSLQGSVTGEINTNGAMGVITAPATPEAQKWDGWKTPALKPSHENWFLIQKPCEDSIARNVLKWGTGGVNVEAVRIGITQQDYELQKAKQHKSAMGEGCIKNAFMQRDRNYEPSTSGRYPANTILICAPECEGGDHAEHCPVSVLNAQTEGTRASKPTNNGTVSRTAIWGNIDKRDDRPKWDDGGNGNNAARYFQQLPHDPDTFRYFPKASKNDRTCNGAVDNVHPTVKSTALMEYFCKLLCPPDGIVLDPFGGSGSTALGAIAAGVNYLLIEQEAEYVAIAQERVKARMRLAKSQLNLFNEELLNA